MKRLFIFAALLLLMLSASAQDNGNKKVTIRWDIAVALDDAINPGGSMPVHYWPPNCTTSGCYSGPPEIVLTGSGTFKYHDNGQGEIPHGVTGGGTWTAYDENNNPTSGTYNVTDVISFTPAPPFGGGGMPDDNIGDSADARSGTAVLAIKYSDGAKGVLVLEGPNYMALGYVSVTKDVMVYLAAHGFGCTDGYCFPEGTVLPIFHVTTK